MRARRHGKSKMTMALVPLVLAMQQMAFASQETPVLLKASPEDEGIQLCSDHQLTLYPDRLELVSDTCQPLGGVDTPQLNSEATLQLQATQGGGVVSETIPAKVNLADYSVQITKAPVLSGAQARVGASQRTLEYVPPGTSVELSAAEVTDGFEYTITEGTRSSSGKVEVKVTRVDGTDGADDTVEPCVGGVDVQGYTLVCKGERSWGQRSYQYTMQGNEVHAFKIKYEGGDVAFTWSDGASKEVSIAPVAGDAGGWSWDFVNRQYCTRSGLEGSVFVSNSLCKLEVGKSYYINIRVSSRVFSSYWLSTI